MGLFGGMWAVFCSTASGWMVVIQTEILHFQFLPYQANITVIIIIMTITLWSLLVSIYPTEGWFEMDLIRWFLIWKDFTKEVTASRFYLPEVRCKLYHSAFYPTENNVAFRVVFEKNSSVEKQRFICNPWNQHNIITLICTQSIFNLSLNIAISDLVKIMGKQG